MNLKKLLKSKRGQSVVEYMLLAAISILALIGSDMLTGSFRRSLNDHFDTTQSRIKVYE